MKALRVVGVPYTDDEIKAAADEVKDKTEMDALVAYPQVLGTAVNMSDAHGHQRFEASSQLFACAFSWA